MDSERMVKIVINKDGNENNASNEQFKVYQRTKNGETETVRVAIGLLQEVPYWAAKIAKEVGDTSVIIE